MTPNKPKKGEELFIEIYVQGRRRAILRTLAEMATLIIILYYFEEVGAGLIWYFVVFSVYWALIKPFMDYYYCKREVCFSKKDAIESLANL